MKAGHWGPLSYLKNGGDGRIRTADGGFADLCLTTWPRRLVRIGAEEGI